MLAFLNDHVYKHILKIATESNHNTECIFYLGNSNSKHNKQRFWFHWPSIGLI